MQFMKEVKISSRSRQTVYEQVSVLSDVLEDGQMSHFGIRLPEDHSSAFKQHGLELMAYLRHKLCHPQENLASATLSSIVWWLG